MMTMNMTKKLLNHMNSGELSLISLYRYLPFLQKGPVYEVENIQLKTKP